MGPKKLVHFFKKFWKKIVNPKFYFQWKYFWKMTALVHEGCYSNVPQTVWLRQQKFLPYSSRGFKSEISILARWIFSESCEEKFCSRLLPLLSRWPRSFCVFLHHCHYVCVHLCIQISNFYKNLSYIGLRSIQMTSF